MTWGAVAAGVGSAVVGGIMSNSGGSQEQAKVEPWGPVKPYIKDVMGEGQNLYNQGAMNPLQMMGLQNQLGYWEQMAPGLIGQTQGAWGQLLDPWSMGPFGGALSSAQSMAGGAENPYAQKLMDMTTEQMIQGFQEGTMPSIQQDTITRGNLGSSRQGIAEGLASQRFNQELANQQNLLASDFYAQNLGQQKAGQGYLNQLLGLGMGTQGNAAQMASNMIGLGGLPSQYQYDIGNTYFQAPWNLLSNYNAAVSPYGSMGTVATEPGVMQGIGGELVGAGLGALGNIDWGGIFGGGA